MTRDELMEDCIERIARLNEKCWGVELNLDAANGAALVALIQFAIASHRVPKSLERRGRLIVENVINALAQADPKVRAGLEIGWDDTYRTN